MKLKPCPFCGGAAGEKKVMGELSPAVRCADKHCPLFHVVVFSRVDWNTRARDPLPDRMAETLRDFVRMFLDVKRYPDPETITTGLRIFLPSARAVLAEYDARKKENAKT